MLAVLAGDTASCNRFSAFSSCSGQNVTLLAGCCCCWPLQTLLGPALESECITFVIFRDEEEEEEEVAVVLDKEVDDDEDVVTFLDPVDVPLTDGDRVTGVAVLTWRGGEALLTPSSTSRSILLSVFIVSMPLLTYSTQYSTVHSTVQYTVQYSTVQYSTVQSPCPC